MDEATKQFLDMIQRSLKSIETKIDKMNERMNESNTEFALLKDRVSTIENDRGMYGCKQANVQSTLTTISNHHTEFDSLILLAEKKYGNKGAIEVVTDMVENHIDKETTKKKIKSTVILKVVGLIIGAVIFLAANNVMVRGVVEKKTETFQSGDRP